MAETRIRVIPDRLFHKLWDEAFDYDDIHSYILELTSQTSENCIKFAKYKIDYVQSCDLLKAIYDMAHKDIASLIRENNIKTSELSHRFCIPIKTIEGWMSAKRTPPEYVKLLIINAYEIKYLPQYIYTESGNKNRERYNNEPKAHTRIKDNKKSEILVSIDDKVFDRRDEETDDYDFDAIDRRMKEFEERYSFSLKSIEKNGSSPKILSDTSYLDNILKK